MEAALAQMRTLPHVRAGFPTLPRLQLAKRLADLCPGRLNIVTYAPTGSLGIESALKLAMINRPAAHRFVTFYHAYHGNTLATMAASWSPTRTSGAARARGEVHAVHAELRAGAEPVLVPLLAARPARTRRPVRRWLRGPDPGHAPARRRRPGGRRS